MTVTAYVVICAIFWERGMLGAHPQRARACK